MDVINESMKSRNRRRHWRCVAVPRRHSRVGDRPVFSNQSNSWRPSELGRQPYGETPLPPLRPCESHLRVDEHESAVW